MVTGLTGPGGRRATVAVAGATSPEPERGMQSEDFWPENETFGKFD
jgi:hypothetical protein